MRHAADDDAPFSESMLEWLDEGDRMGEAQPGSPRPSGVHHVTEHPKRRERLIIGGTVAIGGALVLVLRLMSGKHAAGETAAAVTPVAVPTAAAAIPMPATAPVAVAPAAAEPVAAPPVSAPVIAAPAAAEPQAPQAAPAPAQPAAAVAAVAPAAPAPTAEPVAPPPPPAKIVAAPIAVAAEVPPGVAPRPVEAAAPAASGSFASALSQCRSHVNAGRIRAALSACREATEAQPSSAEALTLLAEAEFTRGHTGEALRLATSATAADQNFADAYVIIGGIYQDKHKDAEARAAYEQYLALQPRGKHASDLRAILSTMP